MGRETPDGGSGRLIGKVETRAGKVLIEESEVEGETEVETESEEEEETMQNVGKKGNNGKDVDSGKTDEKIRQVVKNMKKAVAVDVDGSTSLKTKKGMRGDV